MKQTDLAMKVVSSIQEYMSQVSRESWNDMKTKISALINVLGSISGCGLIFTCFDTPRTQEVSF